MNLLNIVDTLIEKGIDIKRLTVDLIEILKESIIFEYTKDIGLSLIHISMCIRDRMYSANWMCIEEKNC